MKGYQRVPQGGSALRVYAYPTVAAFPDPAGAPADCLPVAIDVLRATSTIATALAAGARAVVPCLTPAEALAAAGERGHGGPLPAGEGRRGGPLPGGEGGYSGPVLGGERGGLRIPGFDLGNSPAEYTAAAVGGRTVLFTTTNGTRAIRKAAALGQVYICSFLNVGAVAAALGAAGRDVAICCAGTHDEFSLEDTACAGALVDALTGARAPGTPAAGVPGTPGTGLELNDLARVAGELFRAHRGALAGLLRRSRHGERLAALGLGDDLERCARLDALAVVPVYRHGQITL